MNPREPQKRFEKHLWIEHVYFSNPANIINSNIINDFFISDLMISDTSSIIYEYLITKKPIIIENNNYVKCDELYLDIKNSTSIMRSNSLKRVEAYITNN